MTTGATGFTRKDDRRGAPTDNFSRQGGLCGLVAAPLSLLAYLMGADSAGADGVAELVELVAGFAGLCFVIGLIARHWHYRWPRWCVGGLVVGVVLTLVGGVLWDTMVPGAVLVWVSAGSFWVGVLVAGIVPRVAMLLGVVPVILGGSLELLGAVLGAVSTAWIGYALWREPDPAESDMDTGLVGH